MHVLFLNVKDNEPHEVDGYALAQLNNVSVDLNTVHAYKGSYWPMQFLTGFIDDPAKTKQKIYGSIMPRQMTDLVNDFKSFINEAKSSITNFKTYCMEKIALNESVGYWTKKHAQHQTAVRKTAALTAFVACSSLVVFIWAAIGLPELEEVLVIIMDASPN